MQAAHAELAQTYARIDELREEVRIVESALRLKDPSTLTVRHGTPPFRLPKTELTFDQTKDIYAARHDLRQEMEALEARRDRLESELLSPEDAEAMRKARADIEAVPEEDALFGGGEIEPEPSYGKHVIRRINETLNRATGTWHATQAWNWLIEKTGLQKPLKALGDWAAERFQPHGHKKEALPASADRNALPPGQEEKAKRESDRLARETRALIDRLDAKMRAGGFGGSEEMLSELPRLTEGMKNLSRRAESDWHGPQGRSDSALMQDERTLQKMIGVVAQYVSQYPERPETAELEGAGHRLLWVLDEVQQELRKRAGARN